MISNYEKQVDIGKAYFLKYDQKVLAAKFRLNMDNNYLYLTYFNTPCRIERLSGTLFEKTTDSWTECRSYETVMTIYDMLCHSTESTLPPLSGKWTPVANFAAAGANFLTEICQRIFRQSRCRQKSMHFDRRSLKTSACRSRYHRRNPGIFFLPGTVPVLGK